MMKFILLATLLFSTFSCASATRTETTTTGNGIANSATEQNANADENAAETTAAGAAQQTAMPEAFVKDLYKTHDADLKANTNRILNGKDRKMLDKYFDKTLADFIWKDLTAKRDEVGVLDFDPFYNAQDTDIKNFSVGQAKVAGDKATVLVTFENSGRKDRLEYVLARQNNAWKIADIKYTDGNTLLGYFKEDAKNNASNNSENQSAEDDFFEGTYKVGETTCTVKPVKMSFEIRWAKGSGVMYFAFDGDVAAGDFTYSSDRSEGGRPDKFIFDDNTFTTGKFVRGSDGKVMPVSKIK